MKVKDLKRLLSQIPEDMTLREWNEMNVLIPVTMEFDGRFISPRVEETGMGELGMDESMLVSEKSFVIVPCGFFQPNEGVPPELN